LIKSMKKIIEIKREKWANKVKKKKIQ